MPRPKPDLRRERILALLESDGPATQERVAYKLGNVAPKTVSEDLLALHRAGLITRRPLPIKNLALCRKAKYEYSAHPAIPRSDPPNQPTTAP
jgi:DNA-binding Lrp family transcriptional regulator